MVRQWKMGRYQRSSTIPRLDTVSCRYTKHGRPQTAGKTGLLEINVVPHDPSEKSVCLSVYVCARMLYVCICLYDGGVQT